MTDMRHLYILTVIAALLVSTMLCTNVQAQGLLVIKKDGTEMRFEDKGLKDIIPQGWRNTAEERGFSINYNGEEIFVSEAELARMTPYGYSTIDIKETPAEAIDLGLPSHTLWASYNIGATKPEDIGSYLAWGELLEKNLYSWETYKYCAGTRTSINKYVTNGWFGPVDNITTLDDGDDVVKQRWGGAWRMPSQAEQNELLTKCTKELIDYDDHHCLKLTGPNGNSIILPYGGLVTYNMDWISKAQSYYWTRNVHTDPNDSKSDQAWAMILWASGGSPRTQAWCAIDRCYGVNVRAVRDSLLLSLKTSNMNVGDELTVPIITGSGHYAVSSSADEIATAHVDGSNVVVKAVSSGMATITLTDTEYNETEYLIITVIGSTHGNAPKDAEPVDLGLPSGTLWCNMNVGANAPEEYGTKFKWGETEESTGEDDWKYYKLCEGSRSTCKDLGEDISGTEYDAAMTVWGGYWRMPTKEQFEELASNCSLSYATVNNMKCVKYTASNGNFILIPYATDSTAEFWKAGHLWSSTLSKKWDSKASFASFGYMNALNMSDADRCESYPVRAVVNK